MTTRYLLVLCLSASAFGQTLNNATVDFTLFGITKPVTMGSTPPASCGESQLFYNTSAPPGLNVLSCDAHNTWTAVGTGTPAVLSAVALSGNYADLLNKPTIPTNTTQLANGAGFLGPTSNAASATKLAATPAGCAAGRYATGITALGVANCTQIQYSHLAGTPTAYALPIATTTRLGGVIDGAGISVSSTGVIAINYGSASGTAAQGNDGRITGAAQKANNLSDLVSVTTALLNLKLTGPTPATIASSTTGNAATATALRGTGALRLKGLCGTSPTLATGQVGLWLDTTDCNMHLQDLNGNQSVMVRTSIAGIDQGCTPGFAMTDISPAGVPVCTALPVPPPPPPSLAGQLCPAGNVVAGVDATSKLVCTALPIVPPPPTGATASGSSCTITAVINGAITAMICTP